MKKIAFTFALIITAVSFSMFGCTNSDDSIIKLNEVTHSIFYAPLYIAINNGYFEEEGLTIELTNGGGADKVMTALTSGAADIGLMGPEATVYVVQQGKKDQPVVFGQLTRCDGSFIIGRENIENFSINDLSNKEILGGRRGGVPAMTLEYAVKNSSVENVTFNYDVSFNNMTAAFLSGVSDFVTAFEPTASEIVAAGKGYILASVGELTGDIPYTAFTANQSYLENNSEKVEKFLKAIYRAYLFLVDENTTIDQIVEAVYPSFSTSTKESLRIGIEAYKKINAWAYSPVMSEESYNNLMDIMISGGELESQVEFSKVVDNSYAQKVMEEFE